MVRNGGRFVVLLPVKSPGTAKSRLSHLSDDERAAVAAAFARDVTTSCLAASEVAEVMVVSDDLEFARTLEGVRPCPDPDSGLNAALRHAATVARATFDGLQPVALCADLPALSSSDLDAALVAAATHDGPCFVPDAEGTGTTLYTATYDDFDPHYGVDSAAAHRRTGALALMGELPSLRRDVDDADDLAEAIALGVGPATRAALAEISAS